MEGKPLLWVLNRSKGCTELNAKQEKRMVEEREIKISPKMQKQENGNLFPLSKIERPGDYWQSEKMENPT